VIPTEREPGGGVRGSQAQQNKWSWSHWEKPAKAAGNTLCVSIAKTSHQTLL